MLAILIYVVAAVAVVVIGLVAVGRETFNASQVMRPAVFEVNEAVEFIADGLDDRTAGRLTPDDVRWILQVDADLLEATDAAFATEVGVLRDDAAVAAVMDRMSESRRALIDVQDVVAVLEGRNRYLQAIGAVGPVADNVSDGRAPNDGSQEPPPG